MSFFEWLEASSFSTWLKLSPSIWAYPTVMFVHTLGLAAAAGASIALDLRLLGVASGTALSPYDRFFPLIWIGFWTSVASGAVLFAADATSAAANPFFLLKLVLVVVAIGLAVPIRRMLRRDDGNAPTPRAAKWLAAASMGAWCGAVASAHIVTYLDPAALASAFVAVSLR